MKSFSEIVAILEAKKLGAGWRAICRAHGGDDPDTLAVTEGDDGRILFKCFKGCTVENILRAYGLDWSDILPEREKPKPGTKTTWVIRDRDGREVAQHVRYDEIGGKKRFVWLRNGKSGLDGMPATALPLYGTELLQWKPDTTVVILCEGEKAADAVRKLGLLGLGTVCGASAMPSAETLRPLVGKRVLLWPDFDEPGIEHMTRIAEALQGIARVKWIAIPNAKPKDDAADYRGTREDLKKVVSAEPPVMRGPARDIGTALDELEKETQRIVDNDLSDFVPTGIAALDRKLEGGLRRGTVTLVGATSGAGKTTLGMQFAMSAQKSGLAFVVSPEMSVKELLFREVIRRSGCPKWELTQWASPTVRARAIEAHRLARARIRAEWPNVVVYDSLQVSLPEAVKTLKAEHQRRKVSFVLFDYAQHLADPQNQKRHLALGDVIQVGLEVARELNCAVLVTSQVNVFKDGREKNYSFRESAVMEHKAHLVLLFLVERDNFGEIEKSLFRVRKARDLQFFELEVEYLASLFTLRGRGEAIVSSFTDGDYAFTDEPTREEGDYTPL